MHRQASDSLSPSSRWAVLALGGYVLLGGVTSFLGWALDIRRLTDWDNIGISIQPNATVCVTLTGLALLALGAQSRRAAKILGAMVGLIGGVTLTEWVTGANFGFDSLLMFGREWGRGGVIVPGRMGPPGSTCWTLIGAALVLASATAGAAQRRFVPALALVTLTLSAISIIAYLYGATALYSLPRLTVIAFQTATFIAAASLALIASVPERNPMRAIVADDAAGLFARQLIPIILLIPIIIGLARVRAEDSGLIDPLLAAALRTIIEIVLFCILLWLALNIVRRHEQAERDLAQRNQAILGSITDAFYTLDPQWRFVFVNDEIVKRFGMPREQIIGKNIWELFPDAVQLEAHAQMHKAMAERITVAYDVFYEPWQRWFHDKVYPKENGGLAVYSQDVTERKKAEQALREADQRKDRFLAMLSHELRTPLTPVLLAVSALGDDTTISEEVRETTQMIRQNLGLQVRLIDDLLDLARIQAGKMRLNRQHHDLNDAVRQACRIIEPMLLEKDLRLDLELGADLPPVLADSDRMAQVLWNLLRNAVKFTPAQGRITVSSRASGEMVQVEVRDTGRGMAAPDLGRIFEEFEQLDHKAGGMGLGLAIARSIVTLHGGRISAHSDGPNKGACFTIELPRAGSVSRQPELASARV